MSKVLEMKTMTITTKISAIKKASKNKLAIQTQIQSVSQKAIDKIKQKEKQMMDKQDEVTEKQMSQLQADVKTKKIEIQLYRQHCEFIDQAVNSECVMDLYDMYQACESGVLMLNDVRNTDTTNKQVIEDIRFTHDSDKAESEVDDLLLGKIEFTDKVEAEVDDLLLGKTEVTGEDETGMMLSPVLLDTIDTKTSRDQQNPCAWDATVLTVDNVRVTVVTEQANKCLKSFYTRSRYRRLSFDKTPWSITQLKENQVMVALPDSKQFVIAEVTPDLVLMSTIATSKSYRSLVVLTPSSLAAGVCSILYQSCVDILNMEGKVLKSVTYQDSVELFGYRSFMCVNKGNLLVSDSWMKSVVYLTPGGDVLWQYTPQGNMSLRQPGGITTTIRGDILLVDSGLNKVIQLNDRGEFAKDVLTSADGLTLPRCIFCTGSGSLLLCDGSLVKELFII